MNKTLYNAGDGSKNLLCSSLTIQVLKSIGQKNADEKTIEKIQAILKNEKKENIINDA